MHIGSSPESAALFTLCCPVPPQDSSLDLSLRAGRRHLGALEARRPSPSAGLGLYRDKHLFSVARLPQLGAVPGSLGIQFYVQVIGFLLGA